MERLTQGGSFQPDYSIFQNPNSRVMYQQALQCEHSTLVWKQELGHEQWKGERDYPPIPGPAGCEMTRPAFLFRDPIQVFDGWNCMGWNDLHSLVACYKHLHSLCSSNNHSVAITYEELVRNPRRIDEPFCLHRDILFSEGTLSYTHGFGGLLSVGDREREIYNDKNPPGLFTSVKSYESVMPSIKPHNLLSHEEIDKIEAELGPLYLDCCRAKIETIKSALLEKAWFGFDLDDTLHAFRKASRAASSAIFEIIARNCNATVTELRTTYVAILSQKTSSALADGKSSKDYRKDRFSALMKAHSADFTDAVLDQLAVAYQNSLESALEIKPGAISLLKYLKQIGKRIAIVTGGPEDAQKWTLEKLGIASYVDVLITSNRFGKSKVDGLFQIALQHLKIDARDIVYVGDSVERDITPARAEGIFSIEFNEVESVVLDSKDLKINSLQKLENVLSF